MTTEKIEKYLEMSKRLMAITDHSEIETLMDEMDEVWYSMSEEEIAEVDTRLSSGNHTR